MHFDVAVIGGGPAGMIAAGRAAELGAKVVLIEKNPTLGNKLLLTGGGRCNILNAELDTHALIKKYGVKGKALFSPFSRFGVPETMEFFETHGLPLKIEPEKRAFPVSDKAESVLRTLIDYMKAGRVTMLLHKPVQSLTVESGKITKAILKGSEVTADRFILATGGKSHPETGSTGDGFPWLRKLGHTVVEPDAALVPIEIKDPWVSRLAGISLQDVRLTVLVGKAKGESRIGKILFTHVGLSGPLVLNMSKRIGEMLKSGDVWLSLDLFPSLDPGAVDRKILEVVEREKNKMLKNAIGEIIQPRLAEVLFMLAGIKPETPMHQLKREEREAFVRVAKNVPMQVAGLLGEEDAIVTSGGVLLDEIDFKTMRSKVCPNLFFAGDILDFDRPSGGFSLQICWTTGYVAGEGAQ